MADLIASARSMTVVSDGQYNAIGLPKGGLTPATITAMVGFTQGQGLERNEKINTAISILQGLSPSDPLYGRAMSAATALNTQASKILNGDPAAFMQKFNTARAHISDSIELKKVTEFCKNQDLSKFGTGMEKFSNLATNGIDGKLGDLGSVANVFKSTGKLFDPSNMETFGTPQGLFDQLSKNKMANATGLNSVLAKNGIPGTELANPAFQEKIKNSFASIKDDATLKAVGEQLEVNNPFAGLPSTTGPTSITQNDAGKLLGGSTASADPAVSAAPAEMNTSPNIWTGVNNTKFFGTGPKKITGFTSENPTAFGSDMTKGQQGTGIQGLKGTPFETFLTGQPSGPVDTGNLESDQAKLNEFLQSGGLTDKLGKLSTGGR